MAQITLLIMSATLMLAVFAHERTRRVGIDMLDVSFLMVMLYFGVYTFIDAIVNEFAGTDAMVVILTFILIFAAMFATWVVYLYLPLRFRSVLRFDNLIEQWVDVDHNVIVIFAVLVVAFSVYIYYEFGILAGYSREELELLEISAPSWIGPAKSLISGIGFGIYIFIVASLLKGRIKVFSIFSVVLLVMIAILALEGRRSILELILIAFVMWSCLRREGIYSFKYVPYVVSMLIILVLGSNIYQTYRQEVFSIEARIEGREITALIPAATNFDATIDNLKDRAAMWNFNYMITAEQVASPLNVFYGALGWQAILNTVPKYFWSSKEVHDIDEMIATFYGFEVTDYPTNNFACLQADFGILMIVLIPIIYLLVLFIVSYYYFAFPKSKNLFLLVSTLCLQYLIKVENSYGDIFILLRNIIFLTGLFLIIDYFRHFTRRNPALQ